MRCRTTLTELVCLKCGNIDVIQRETRHLRESRHIKDLWCYKCKETTKHYEIKDKQLFKFKDIENELDLYVKYLLYEDEFQKPEIDEKIKKLIK